MKKTYMKPEIYFESFTLSTNIAGDCDDPFSLQAKDACPIPDDNDLGMSVFNPDLGGGCTVLGTGNEIYNGFCYHTPTETNNLFNS